MEYRELLERAGHMNEVVRQLMSEFQSSAGWPLLHAALLSDVAESLRAVRDAVAPATEARTQRGDDEVVWQDVTRRAFKVGMEAAGSSFEPGQKVTAQDVYQAIRRALDHALAAVAADLGVG